MAIPLELLAWMFLGAMVVLGLAVLYIMWEHTEEL